MKKTLKKEITTRTAIATDKTFKGKESRKAVMIKFGIEVEKKEVRKYTFVDGVPCKKVNGVLVPLTKVENN